MTMTINWSSSSLWSGWSGSLSLSKMLKAASVLSIGALLLPLLLAWWGWWIWWWWWWSWWKVRCSWYQILPLSFVFHFLQQTPQRRWIHHGSGNKTSSSFCEEIKQNKVFQGWKFTIPSSLISDINHLVSDVDQMRNLGIAQPRDHHHHHHLVGSGGGYPPSLYYSLKQFTSQSPFTSGLPLPQAMIPYDLLVSFRCQSSLAFYVRSLVFQGDEYWLCFRKTLN